MTGGPDPRRVSAAEIAALTRRLRALSDAGRDADARERAEFLADKQALLDRITDHDQHREETMPSDDQAADRRAGEEVRTEFDAVPGPVLHRHNVFDDRGVAAGLVDDDDDGRVSGGYEAAHQAHLDYLAEGGDRGADARAAEAAQAAEAADLGRADRPEEIAARIQEIRDQLHAQALAEDQQRTPATGAVEDSDGLGDGAGWSR